MTGIKTVDSIMKGAYTMDGAGVRLLRVFGGPGTFQKTDPFLLLDYFGSSIPSEYEKGFPWHPHRGIETFTYQIKGKTSHEDSNGNKGTIYPGEVQDMSAGSGIFHEEMPTYITDNANEKTFDKTVLGLQLWINTPSARKMKTPEYKHYSSPEFPVYHTDGGSAISILSGRIGDTEGPYHSKYDLNLTYLHMHIKKDDFFELNNLDGNRIIMFNYSGLLNVQGSTEMKEKMAYLLSVSGDRVLIEGGDSDSDVILIGGRPTDEHIEWYGPIVMNTREQLNEAIMDLNNGTFVREKEPIIEQ